MSAWRLVLAWMAARPVLSGLSLLLVGLGVGTVVLASLVTEQLDTRIPRDAAGIDLVVGARGSAVQLVPASVYRLDLPRGHTPLASLASVRDIRIG